MRTVTPRQLCRACIGRSLCSLEGFFLDTHGDMRETKQFGQFQASKVDDTERKGQSLW